MKCKNNILWKHQNTLYAFDSFSNFLAYDFCFFTLDHFFAFLSIEELPGRSQIKQYDPEKNCFNINRVRESGIIILHVLTGFSNPTRFNALDTYACTQVSAFTCETVEPLKIG